VALSPALLMQLPSTLPAAFGPIHRGVGRWCAHTSA
jgi:hypothetical protein